jgi:hypothetical protein
MDRDGTEIGVLYPPEVLEALFRRRPDLRESTPFLAAAVRDGTPVVVMWKPPDLNPEPAATRKYKVAIAGDSGDEANPERIDPLWIRNDARDLEQLDPRTNFQPIGAVGAFPREAFGNLAVIVIYRSEWTGAVLTGHRRAGKVDWSGSIRQP